MEEIKEHLHLDVMTVTGKTLGENLEELKRNGFYEKCEKWLQEFNRRYQVCLLYTSYRKECTASAYAQIDLSICMENMWLATDEVGLGGVWMGIAPLEDRMEEVEKIIGIPESQRAFGIFALGYPAEERTQQDRYDETRIHRVTRG